MKKYKALGIICFVVAGLFGLIFLLGIFLLILVTVVIDMELGGMESGIITWFIFHILVVTSLIIIGIRLVRGKRYRKISEEKIRAQQQKKEELARRRRLAEQEYIAGIRAEKVELEKQRKQKEEEENKLIDKPVLQLPQTVHIFRNGRAGLESYILYFLCLCMVAGVFVAVPIVAFSLQREMLIVCLFVLACLLWGGAYASQFPLYTIENAPLKAFVVTSEDILYCVSFRQKSYGKEPITKIGKIIYTSKVIGAEADLKTAQRKYLLSDEFEKMIEKVINRNGELERDCMVCCLNSPNILRKTISGIIIRYFDEESRCWKKCSLPKSNEGYEQIVMMIERRMKQKRY